MKKLPSISVITPSFNQGKFIGETIDSVLDQKYPSLEYWVIDGGSTDNTKKILKSYGKKIHWLSEKDKGQTDALNKGMKKAKGEVVCYLNSDDVFLPGTLLKIGETFAKNPKALWVSGDYMIINEKGQPIQSFVTAYKRFFRQLNWQDILKVLNYINQPSTFWKRSAFKKIGYFNESLRYCMDYDFWLRLQQLQSPLIISEVLSKFRIHGSSKGGSQYKQQFKEEGVVERTYTQNLVLRCLHSLHSTATVLAYNVIKSSK